MSFRGSIYPLFKINKCLDNLYRVRLYLQGTDKIDSLYLRLLDEVINNLKSIRVSFI